MNNQIMITLQQIKDNDPCTDGWRKVLKANGGRSADFSKPFPVSSILDSNNLEDTFWVIRFLPEHDLLWRRYALWCALQVKDNTKDLRVHECLKTVERFCNGEATEEELSAARSAAQLAAHSVGLQARYPAALAAIQSAVYAATARLAAELVAGAATYSASESAGAEARYAARSAQEDKLREVLDTGVCTLR